MNAQGSVSLDASVPVVSGTLHGVGLGPGDPELLTVRAARLIGEARAVAYFAKAGRKGHARTIAAGWINAACEEFPLFYPVTTEIHFADAAYVHALSAFYDASAERLAATLAAGSDVVLLCEGDPMFYGSFMHLYERLRDRFRVSITPGVPGMAGCWAAAGASMTWGDDALVVLPGTLDEDALVQRLGCADAAVIMKLGSNFAKVRRALRRTGLDARAIYVERGTMDGELVLPLRDKPDDKAPYFALVLVPGQGRRP